MRCSCPRRETRARGRDNFSRSRERERGKKEKPANQNLKAQDTRVEGKKGCDKGHCHPHQGKKIIPWQAKEKFKKLSFCSEISQANF